VPRLSFFSSSRAASTNATKPPFKTTRAMHPPTRPHATLLHTHRHKRNTMRELLHVVVAIAALAAPGLAFVPPSSSSRPSRTRVSIHPPKNGIPGTWAKTLLACLWTLSLPFPLS
jgi:hypothetical protein